MDNASTSSTNGHISQQPTCIASYIFLMYSVVALSQINYGIGVLVSRDIFSVVHIAALRPSALHRGMCGGGMETRARSNVGVSKGPTPYS